MTNFCHSSCFLFTSLNFCKIYNKGDVKPNDIQWASLSILSRCNRSHCLNSRLHYHPWDLKPNWEKVELCNCEFDITTVLQKLKLLKQMRFPKSEKALQRYLVFLTFYRNSVPRMAEKLNPFYKLLKAQVAVNITSKLKETFYSVNKPLNDASQLALKQPIPGKKLVLKTDASFSRAADALMIEDNPDQKSNQKRKLSPPSRLDQKFFPRTTKDVNLLERILGNLYGNSWICTQPVVSIKTDNCLNGQ